MREMIEDMVDSIFDAEGDVKIGNLTFSRSYIVSKLDPIAYREAVADMADSLLSDLRDELDGTDDEEERDRAAMRMEKAGLATASHYAFADSFAEKLYFEVDRNWRGELPFTALVTSEGVRTTITGGPSQLLRETFSAIGSFERTARWQ